VAISRRAVLQLAAVGGLSALARTPSAALAQTASPVAPTAIEPNDRVFIANEDSSTISVIDPRSNTVDTTIDLTSFDEDPRPPFITGGGRHQTQWPGTRYWRKPFHRSVSGTQSGRTPGSGKGGGGAGGRCVHSGIR
jgi:YVTN family beta-propeller protein